MYTTNNNFMEKIMNLPNPQTMTDAQSINIFAQAVSRAAVEIINSADATTHQYAEMKAYFDENMPKLKEAVERLSIALG